MSEAVLKQTLELFKEARTIQMEVQSLKANYEYLNDELKRNISILTDQKLAPEQFSTEIEAVLHKKLGWDALDKKLTEIVVKEAKKTTDWGKIRDIVEDRVRRKTEEVAYEITKKALEDKEITEHLEELVKSSIVPIVEKAFVGITLKAIKPIIAEEIKDLPKQIIEKLHWNFP